MQYNNSVSTQACATLFQTKLMISYLESVNFVGLVRSHIVLEIYASTFLIMMNAFSSNVITLININEVMEVVLIVPCVRYLIQTHLSALAT